MKQLRSQFERTNPLLLFCAAVCVIVGANILSMGLDRSVLVYDVLYKYTGAMDFHRCFFREDVPCPSFLACSKSPPLLNLLGAFFFPYEVGGDPDRLCLLEQIFLVLFMIGVYACALRLNEGEKNKAPLFAAVVAGTSPAVVGMSKTFMHDLPMAAMLWTAFAALLWSDGYRKLLPSLLSGIFIGLGLLMRQTISVFLLIPWMVFIFAAFRRKEKRRTAFAGLALGIVPVFLIAGPWYSHCFFDTWYLYFHFMTKPLAAADSVQSPEFLGRFLFTQIGTPLMLAAAVGAVRVVRQKELRRRLGLFFIAALGTLVSAVFFFSMVEWKLERFSLALVPIFALLAALGLRAPSSDTQESTARGRRPLIVLQAIVLLTSAFFFFYVNFASKEELARKSVLNLFYPNKTIWAGGDAMDAGVLGVDSTGVRDYRKYFFDAAESKGLGSPRVLRWLFIADLQDEQAGDRFLTECRLVWERDCKAVTFSEGLTRDRFDKKYPELLEIADVILVERACAWCVAPLPVGWEAGKADGLKTLTELLDDQGRLWTLFAKDDHAR